MKMYYITRYEHNPNKRTEYYAGDGVWTIKIYEQIRMRLFENEEIVKAIISNLTECDWHSVEIRS